MKKISIEYHIRKEDEKKYLFCLLKCPKAWKEWT